MEDYNAALNLNLRPSILKLKGYQGKRDVVWGAMRYNLKDSVYTTNELVRKRDNLRRQLKKEHGQRTVTTRKILRDLNAEAEDVRKTTREDNLAKIDHLHKKFKKKKEEEEQEIPENVKEYAKAKVFNKETYNNIEIEEISVTVIGQVELSDEENAVLRLHPKFSIRDDITEENLDFEQELGYAKVRYELRKENEETLV